MNPKFSATSIAVENPIFDSAACFGLCAKCANAHIMIGEKRPVGFCAHYSINNGLKLDLGNPVEKCYSFSPRGQLSIYEMQKIATIIDVTQRKAGFGPDIFEVLVTHPKDGDDE